MKKISLVLAIMLCVGSAYSQGALPLHVNYAASDKAIYGSGFDYAPYRLHSQHDSLAVGMLFAVCDTFPDLVSGNFYSKDFLPALRLDSIRIRINLNKHSAQNDTLLLGIAGTVNGIFPHENTYYTDSIIFNTSVGAGSTYASSVYYTIPVGEYVTNSYTVFFMFKGAANDTLNLWSGYGYDGVCGTQPTLKRAQQTHFFPNAFAYRKQYTQILPTINGQDIFYECDTVPGFDTLTDGRNYIQNWDIDYYLTATTAGVQENVFADSPLLYPNPGQGMFYTTKACTRISVWNATGAKVFEALPQANSVYLPLPAGFYTVRMETETGTGTQKLIIADK